MNQNQTPPNLNVVAAFDFDGTVSYRDTLLPFLLYLRGPWVTFFKLFALLPSLIIYAMGGLSRQETKERVLTSFIKGWSIEELRKKGLAFAKERLPQLVKPEAMSRLQWHQEKGHRCILISASLDIYLEPWAKLVGFHDVITSRLQTTDLGIVTGTLIGKNCWGSEKTRRLEILLGQRAGYNLYAYGDSRGDLELLSLADHAYYRKIPM